MTQIKLCGLTREEDIAAVNRWRPDYVGFVFANSRRRVTPEQARYLKDGLDPRIKAVGVFTNEPVPFIIELCETGVIEMVQLHGDETEEYIRALKRKTACPVIKAIRVQSTEQLLQAEKLSCDLLLLDAYQKGQYGGSGKTFDRALIPRLHKPFFLAGGLESGNIAQAVGECHPFGIDVSSGAETDGLKDESKIRQIIEIIRSRPSFTS
ncbi:phosphoribosylanthranilate isomerase [Desulfosporosinus metallidurans]|uniref:N-(5'-phosphoribosyl)anthranilate isomerase n=1 Tax=Desulfosporosinus metallidurans TaxID=1888891 RepID=A0A1Q8QJ71_9FIRM|nr:phosphoribosylanthranilate isomerase [Desulfosporosinus metallidurans]OLN27328.1 Phosphoribosylanthranilate isomerase [Desulfosporosinus metallidurans]